MAFEPYDATTLFDILAARREVALQRGVVDAQLERIIVEADGSARFGVQALRSAVDLGIDRGHTTVKSARTSTTNRTPYCFPWTDPEDTTHATSRFTA